MSETEFKEKARRHIFNVNLREFPVAFELYSRSFPLSVDVDLAMGQIVSIIRTSENITIAYAMVCHYLDDIERGSRQ